jgi:CheY-like chemotaxis protein
VKTECLPILAAEDEESDAFILRLAFERAGLPNPLIIVRDGQEAVNYLSGSPPYADRFAHPLPAVVMLDLKMPRRTGFDVLAWMAERPELKSLRAVILSSSSAEADIQKARGLGALDYFIKPHSLPELVSIILKVKAQCLG